MVDVALIMAKEGSIGLPGKNTMKYKDTNLLEMTIRELQESKVFESIYVSSNSEQILQMSESYGAKRIERDDAYAANSKYIDSVNDAAKYIGKDTGEQVKTITIPQVVQPIREKGIFARMLKSHGDGVSSVVTVTKFESSISWIYKVNNDTQLLEKSEEVNYRDVIAREDNIFYIDNAVVSFTYESYKNPKDLTSWPYLGENIAAVEQTSLNSNFFSDINNADDAEWFEFIMEYPKWKKNRSK